MAESRELATIDSGSEIVVHLQNLGQRVTIGELAGLLSLAHTDILASLQLAANQGFTRALYEDLRTGPWGGELLADQSLPMHPRWHDVVELPPEALLTFDEVLAYLELGTERGHIHEREWVLPPRDLVVPIRRSIREIQDSINDPNNTFAAHINASASGRIVDMQALSLTSNTIVTVLTPQLFAQDDCWRGPITNDDLRFLADWIGRAADATYRIALLD